MFTIVCCVFFLSLFFLFLLLCVFCYLLPSWRNEVYIILRLLKPKIHYFNLPAYNKLNKLHVKMLMQLFVGFRSDMNSMCIITIIIIIIVITKARIIVTRSRQKRCMGTLQSSKCDADAPKYGARTCRTCNSVYLWWICRRACRVVVQRVAQQVDKN